MGSKKDNAGPFLPDVDHEGHPGYTIQDLKNNLNWMLPDFDPQPLPQIVILMIGTNDFLQYTVRIQTGRCIVICIKERGGKEKKKRKKKFQISV